MVKATRLICGHTFCSPCIDEISMKAGYCTFGCETNFKQTSRNFVVEGIVEELVGECIKCREWKGGFEHFMNHLEKCDGVVQLVQKMKKPPQELIKTQLNSAKI